MESAFRLAHKLIGSHELTKEEYAELISAYESPDVKELLRKEALELRKKYYGDKIYIRGLIEFTNYCKNNCYYCGIRRDNANAQRYRLSKKDILSCCKIGNMLGFRTFVLQGGEDPYYSDEMIADIVADIKNNWPECAVTLSIGEKSYEAYKMYREAGADRYLLRHETADDEHYRFLHPKELSLSNRKRCLYDLKSLGYQVGAGFMVGSPGQTPQTLAEDMVFLHDLHPHMVGIGPFIPHHDTRYANEPAGSVELTLFMLSVIRIALPKVLLPATTALGTMDPMGREKGFLAGANVVMPNLSPLSTRKKYELYDNKICTGDEAAECINCLGRRTALVGCRIVKERGDSPEAAENGLVTSLSL